jgi:signal transduction histidine kinase
MNMLAEGNFKTRLKFSGAIAHHPTFTEISDSFNTLAEELENIEILRSDFINDFSHEFKTPIVSIAGLAKLVNKGNLTDEQREEYLNAIEEESLRLAAMATNVLKLTKVEKQNILSDVTEFNLSEQIRSCILLLEDKWTQKDIVLELDFDEYTIHGEEELLKEVWINLFDNAIKFSQYGGAVSAEITDTGKAVRVSVSNSGKGISEDNIKKIWNKFYQADESHTSEGNGIGLAIVKRIVDLHNGTVSAFCADDKVTFTVELPKKA